MAIKAGHPAVWSACASKIQPSIEDADEIPCCMVNRLFSTIGIVFECNETLEDAPITNIGPWKGCLGLDRATSAITVTWLAIVDDAPQFIPFSRVNITDRSEGSMRTHLELF